MSLNEAVQTLLDKEQVSPVRSVIARLADRMREGKAFSDAMAEQPTHFPALFVGIDHAPKELIDKYRGRFDAGWNAMREQVPMRQQEMGLVKRGSALSARDLD